MVNRLLQTDIGVRMCGMETAPTIFALDGGFIERECGKGMRITTEPLSLVGLILTQALHLTHPFRAGGRTSLARIVHLAR